MTISQIALSFWNAPRRARASSRRRGWAALLQVLAIFSGAVVFCEPTRGADWHTDTYLRDELDAPLVATWSNAPLRGLLHNLSQSKRVAIWLDRRIDPGKLIDYTPRDLPLRVALEQLSEKYYGGVSVVGSVVYIAPVRSAEKLATLAAIKRGEAQKISGARGKQFLAQKSWSWPERAEPRELIQQLLDEAQLAPRNLDEMIPHDLWPAQSLPPTTWSDRMTLALAGFGLTYKIVANGQGIVFEPWPDNLSYEQSFAVKGDVGSVLEQLRPKFPQTELRSSSGRLVAAGRYEDLEQIERLVRGEKVVRNTKVTTKQTTYTLTVEQQPLGPTAKAIGERIGVKVEIAPELEEKLGTPISFKVVDASLPGLWQALAKAAGVKVDVSADRVRLSPE